MKQIMKINESYSGNHEEINFDLKNLAVSAAIAASSNKLLHSDKLLAALLIYR